IASFISYGLEKAVSKHPEKFGTGVPEGVAAPEGANNGDTGGPLVPSLALGLPGRGSTAILLSALSTWGVRPAPLIMTENPQRLRLPVYVLFPFIFGISIVGVYGSTGRLFDLGLLAGFGLLGYIMAKLKYPAAPLILGFVLGDAMERALRQSLMMSQGDVKML